tara:strand:+ start:1065 stop:1745 length:681 start_codon:yes stop_codon:yes gene_type:complete
MNFINDFEKSKNIYSKKINTSRFLEGNQMKVKKGVEDICELIIGKNELYYQSCNSLEKSQFIIDKKLEIASNLFSHFNKPTIKKFNRSLIEAGFQKLNIFSSILYLNEYYKVNCIIYNEQTNEYYQTTVKKEYEPIYCLYKNNSWYLKEELNDKDIIFSDIHNLGTILTMDIDTIYIFKPYLSSLSNYKVKELEEIAKQNDIDIYQGQKKKVKKELFDEINLKFYQ